MTHSGSRGIGNKVGHYYAKIAEEETAQRSTTSPKEPGGSAWTLTSAKNTSAVMNLMVRYAKACHEIIETKFREFMGLTIFSHIASVHNTAVVTKTTWFFTAKGQLTPPSEPTV